MLKNIKSLVFLIFPDFFAKNCPEKTIFFIIGGQFFFHTPSLSVTNFFYSFGLFHQVQNVRLCSKNKKGTFFLFFLIFSPKNARKRPLSSFLVVNFFSHTPSLSVIYCFLQFLTVSSGLKYLIKLKNMK